MHQIIVNTQKKKQVIDITDHVEKYVSNGESAGGICVIYVAHTTAAVTVADLDPGTDLDMIDAFEAIMPRLRYRHPHNPNHVGDHIWSSIIGVSTSLIYDCGKLVLGSWQKIVLIEFDGPRERTVYLKKNLC